MKTAHTKGWRMSEKISPTTLRRHLQELADSHSRDQCWHPPGVRFLFLLHLFSSYFFILLFFLMCDLLVFVVFLVLFFVLCPCRLCSARLSFHKRTWLSMQGWTAAPGIVIRPSMIKSNNFQLLFQEELFYQRPHEIVGLWTASVLMAFTFFT